MALTIPGGLVGVPGTGTAAVLTELPAWEGKQPRALAQG